MSMPAGWPTPPGCRVRMRYASIGPDGPDDDTDPDWRIPVGTEVHISPSITSVALEDVVAPIQDLTGTINEAGMLVSEDGLPVVLLATDDDRLSTTGWYWTAQIVGTGIRIEFPAPAGTIVNLADYLRVPPTGEVREWIERIPELVEVAGRLEGVVPEITTARDETLAARDATEAAVTTGLAWSGAVDLGSLADAPRVLHATLAGNVSITLPTPAAAARAYTVTLCLTQDATGGRSVTLPGARLAFGAPYQAAGPAGSTDVLHALWTGLYWLILPAAQRISAP